MPPPDNRSEEGFSRNLVWRERQKGWPDGALAPELSAPHFTQPGMRFSELPRLRGSL